MSAYLRTYGVTLTDSYAIYIPLLKYATPTDFAVAADWTPAAGDVKVSIDNGAAANIGTLPSYVTSKGWKFILSDTELTGKNIQVRVMDSATKAVCDDGFTVETMGNASAFWPDATAANPIKATIEAVQGDVTAAANILADYTPAVGFDKVGGRVFADSVVDDIWAKTMTELSSIPGVTGTVLEALQFVFLLSRNKLTQTSTTTTLRNNADSSTIGSSTVSDDGTTATRGKWA